MISDRLKGIIFKKLYSDLSRVEIIHYKTFIWFIDREDKCWYFRYDKSNGQLLWKYGFFSNFFTIFTMDSDEFAPVISSWVEEVLNCKVTTTHSSSINQYLSVEEVLNCKVTTTATSVKRFHGMVEDALNHKVNTTSSGDGVPLIWVKEVLNHNVGI